MILVVLPVAVTTAQEDGAASEAASEAGSYDLPAVEVTEAPEVVEEQTPVEESVLIPEDPAQVPVDEPLISPYDSSHVPVDEPDIVPQDTAREPVDEPLIIPRKSSVLGEDDATLPEADDEDEVEEDPEAEVSEDAGAETSEDTEAETSENTEAETSEDSETEASEDEPKSEDVLLEDTKESSEDAVGGDTEADEIEDEEDEPIESATELTPEDGEAATEDEGEDHAGKMFNCHTTSRGLCQNWNLDNILKLIFIYESDRLKVNMNVCLCMYLIVFVLFI